MSSSPAAERRVRESDVTHVYSTNISKRCVAPCLTGRGEEEERRRVGVMLEVVQPEQLADAGHRDAARTDRVRGQE